MSKEWVKLLDDEILAAPLLDILLFHCESIYSSEKSYRNKKIKNLSLKIHDGKIEFGKCCTAVDIFAVCSVTDYNTHEKHFGMEKTHGFFQGVPNGQDLCFGLGIRFGIWLEQTKGR